MCCIAANLLKIIVIIVSAFLLFVIALQMVSDLICLRKGDSVEDPGFRIATWKLHCFCGTLMTVLKLKDLCYLHWWQLITSAFIIGGFWVIYLLPESDDFGIGQKASNYFILEYMLLTLLAVACYTRTLRPQQEV